MTTRRQKLIVISFILCWLWPSNSQAASSIAISEVAAFEPEGREWVEIVNASTEAIDLTGWKFVEDNTNHSLKLFNGASAVLEAGQYAIIADDAAQFQTAYSEVAVTIFDSSWGTLKETGELIGLRDTAGNIVEQFTYAAVSGGTAERINLTVSGDDATNWQLSPTGHSAGRVNSVVDSIPPETPPAEVPPVVPEPTDIGQEDPPAKTDPVLPAALPCDVGQLQLSELVSDPIDGEEEYVELRYGGARSAALAGWSIADGAGRTTAMDSLFVLPASFVVIEKPKGVLNNGGDQVVLQCSSQTVDTVTYGNWDDGNKADNAPAPADPWSLMRDEQNQWVVTTTPTKGQNNQYTAPPVPEVKVRAPVTANKPLLDTVPVTTDETTDVEPSIIVGDTTGCVQLSELLPNPEGDDAAGEFIELLNCDSRALNLTGWSLSVGTRKYKIAGEQATIESGAWLSLPRSVSKLTLRNGGGDSVTLLQPDGSVVDKVEYSTAPSGQSYAKVETEWQWTAEPTPGAANKIINPNEPPTAEFQLVHPRRTEVGESITADATDGSDAEDSNEQLQYAWDWGDGTNSTGMIVEHSYAQAGQYKVTLVVTDTAGAVDRVSRTLTIYALTANTEPTAATKPRQASSSVTIKITPVELSAQALNRKVQLIGTVVALPGVFGRQVMMIDGAEVYFGAADWPALAVGDVVQLTGSVGNSAGQKRLRLANQDALAVQRQSTIAPAVVTSLEAGLNRRLVQVTGTVAEVRKTEFLLAGDFGQLPVVIKKSTDIGEVTVAVGQEINVVGVLMQIKNDWQLWPRMASDIQVSVVAAEAEVINVAAAESFWWQPAATGFGAVGALWQVVQGTMT